MRGAEMTTVAVQAGSASSVMVAVSSGAAMERPVTTMAAPYVPDGKLALLEVQPGPVNCPFTVMV